MMSISACRITTKGNREMHRCYIEPDGWHEGLIVPPDTEAHHLLHVMRATEGTPVKVFDGRGHEARAVVRIASPGCVELVIKEVNEVEPPPFKTILIAALPKNQRADLIFEKATELGCTRIIPIISERVVSRPDKKRAAKKRERWCRICESAAKQCGTPWLPQIDAVTSFKDVLTKLPEFDAVLLGSLEEGSRPLKEVIGQLQKKAIGSVAVVIGPEGDFTAGESKAMLDVGALPVSFGDLTLRAETAAIFALSILAYEFR